MLQGQRDRAPEQYMDYAVERMKYGQIMKKSHGQVHVRIVDVNTREVRA